jgi:hypothetical protein
VAVIVLGERGRAPHLTLLACTVHEDRIEAQGYILHRPLLRGRALASMTRGEAGPWQVLRGALRARVPRLVPPGGGQGQVSLHQGLTVPLVRRGRKA